MPDDAPDQTAASQDESEDGQEEHQPLPTTVRETIEHEYQVEPAVYGEGVDEAAPDSAANANVDVEVPGGENDPGADASLDED